MFSLTCVNKSFAFLFDSFPEIMQKPLFFQYKTALGAPAETPQEGPLGTPKSVFLALVGLWGASGVQGPFWRPTLDFVGRIFGLGSSLGLFLDASGTSSVFFSNFLPPSGIRFSKKIDYDFCFASGCMIKHLCSYLIYFLKFGIPEIMVVTS